MGQFLRFALLIVLVFVGFGSGICGAYGFVVLAFDHPTNMGGVIVAAALLSFLVAVGCFFAVRALARGLRRDPMPAPTAAGLDRPATEASSIARKRDDEAG